MVSRKFWGDFWGVNFGGEELFWVNLGGLEKFRRGFFLEKNRVTFLEENLGRPG